MATTLMVMTGTKMMLVITITASNYIYIDNRNMSGGAGIA